MKGGKNNLFLSPHTILRYMMQFDKYAGVIITGKDLEKPPAIPVLHSLTIRLRMQSEGPRTCFRGPHGQIVLVRVPSRLIAFSKERTHSRFMVISLFQLSLCSQNADPCRIDLSLSLRGPQGLDHCC